MSSLEEEPNSFYGTPGWSIPAVVAIILSLTFLMKRLLECMRNWLEATNRLSVLGVIEQIEEELKIIGFMSLGLKETSKLLSTICIPYNVYTLHYFRCNGYGSLDMFGGEVPPNNCKKKGYRPIMKYEGLEDVHRFIFFTTVMHMFLACFTLFVAYRKVRKCRAWEEEAHLMNMAIPGRRIRRRNAICMCMTSFFRQLGRSIDRADYLTLRQGFIRHHNLPPTFDFYHYTIRSIGEQFRELVVISVPLRVLFAVLLLIFVSVYVELLWLQPVSGILLLVVGTKLRYIVASLARESAEPTFRPRVELFWFNKPKWVLLIIRVIHFQSSFIFASFLWFWWKFKIYSCIMWPIGPHLLGLILGFLAQCHISFIAFPTYVLATQMTANLPEAEELDQQLIPNVNTNEEALQQGVDAAENVVEREIELQQTSNAISDQSPPASNETSTRVGTPLLRRSASVPLPVSFRILQEIVPRSSTMPR